MIVNEALVSCGYFFGLLRENELIKDRHFIASSKISAASASSQLVPIN